MNPLTDSNRPRDPSRALRGLLLGLLVLSPALLHAQARKNPASKVYVSDVSGEATIDTGDSIEDLTKRAVYTVQGAIIETKKPERESDRTKYFSTMVFSNGTGAFFHADTRVEVKRFLQEPFTPNRSDLEVEPSISQTQAFVARGVVGLCSSRLVAGSNMTYITPHASVNIRGRKIVIEAGNDFTKISMLEGDSTVRAGPLDTGGHMVRSGEQAIVRRGEQGQPNTIEIRRIPKEEAPQLDDRVAMACMARKTVYFDVRERRPEAEEAGALAQNDDAAAGSGTDSAFSRVTAFDGTAGAGGGTQEIVPIEILPPKLPVEYTVSTASLTSSPGP